MDPIIIIALLIWSGAAGKLLPISGGVSIVLASMLILIVSAVRGLPRGAFVRPLTYCAPLVALAAISGVWAEDPANWIGKLLSFLLLLVAAAAYAQQRPDALNILVRTLMVYGIVHSGLSLLLIYSGSPLGRVSATHLVGILTHKTALTNMSAICAVAAFWCLIWGKRSLLLSLISLALSAWILLIGGGGQATLGAAIAAVVMITKRYASPRLAHIAYVAIGIAMVALPFYDQLPDLLSSITGKDNNLTGRVAFWKFGRDMISAQPILGYGFSNVGYTAAWSSFQLSSLYLEYGSVTVAPNMHNQWIELTFMLGIVGLAVGVVLLIILPTWYFGDRRGIDVQAIGICTVLMVFSGFNSNLILNAPEPFLFFCTLFCALLGQQTHRAEGALPIAAAPVWRTSGAWLSWREPKGG